MNDLTRLTAKPQIIYDVDETLATLQIDWAQWHPEVAKIFRQFDPAFVENGHVHPYQNDMVHRFGQPLRDQLNSFNATYELDHYRGLLPNRPLIDFIKAHPEKQHHILTSQNRLLLTKVLSELDLQYAFTTIITRDEVMQIKPNPEGILKILGNQSVADFMYLGDASSDEQTAQAVGMDFEYIEIH